MRFAELMKRWVIHCAGFLSIAVIPFILTDLERLETPKQIFLFSGTSALGALLSWFFIFDARKFMFSQGKAGTLNQHLDYRKLAAALQSAFSFEEMSTVVRFRLARDIEVMGDLANQNWPEQVVQTAKVEGWLPELIDAVQHAKPYNKSLAAIRSAAGLGVAIDEDSALERIINQRGVFQEPEEFIVRLGQVGSRVCRLSYPAPGGTLFATAFLVSPDCILTNYHVIENIVEGRARYEQVECLFDFKKTKDGRILPGTTCGLAANWLLDFAKPSVADVSGVLQAPGPDELDFALLRLARDMGSEPLGGSGEPGAPMRGFIQLPVALPAIAGEDTVLILQHPSGEPKKLTFGNVTDISDLRIRYNANTLGGSSGSPCFTTNLEIFGLHHAGDPNTSGGRRPEYNQAIPIHLIATRIKAHLVVRQLI